MGHMKENDDLWEHYHTLTPMKGPGGRTREEATKKPGNSVKSFEHEGSMGFPKFHGVLAEYDDVGHCVVIGHNSSVSSKFVWIGTTAEYHQVWDVD